MDRGLSRQWNLCFTGRWLLLVCRFECDEVHFTRPFFPVNISLSFRIHRNLLQETEENRILSRVRKEGPSLTLPLAIVSIMTVIIITCLG